jgi:hypothetical protein
LPLNIGGASFGLGRAESNQSRTMNAHAESNGEKDETQTQGDKHQHADDDADNDAQNVKNNAEQDVAFSLPFTMTVELLDPCIRLDLAEQEKNAWVKTQAKQWPDQPSKGNNDN